MKTLSALFLIFARIGGFTFGGGYAMLPMMQKELVEKKKWVSNDELLDYFAIGQCTPGVIAVNTATFVGYKTKGFPGAVSATLGVITPSIVIITCIAVFISNFQELEVVQHAFGGIRAAVVALILSAILKMRKKSLVDIFTVIVFIAVALLSLLTDLSPVIFVVSAAVCGIIIKIRKEKTSLKKKEDNR
ncbi:MAG: chromate transporter [Clostridia bacterium]|nr:chromate transporter [Clostridia bacterium]